MNKYIVHQQIQWYIILDVPKIMDYENNVYFIALSQNFHPLGLFKYKHSKEQNFPTLFYEQPRQIFESFSYQQIV